jgi:hypothetical protein
MSYNISTLQYNLISKTIRESEMLIGTTIAWVHVDVATTVVIVKTKVGTGFYLP